MSEAVLPGTLYLVPTPLGNLDDITLRALAVLRDAALVLAEDTRTARRLFERHTIHAPLLSYTEHNHARRLPQVLERLRAGENVALISEAGMPAISDPGAALVRAIWEAGGRVCGLPGPSAVVLAMAVSGFAGSFTFLGFLPRQGGERRALLRREGSSGHALVVFETPHRLRAALADIAAVLGDRPLCICRELTKLHEEIFRGTAAEALAHFTAPRGEFTVVIAPAALQQPEAETTSEALERFFLQRRATGARARDAVAEAMARFGVPRRVAYDAWTRTQPEGESTH
jgi:16S rRNA (cytidine1402-2'-O)-methyltransferase